MIKLLAGGVKCAFNITFFLPVSRESAEVNMGILMCLGELCFQEDETHETK